MSTQNQITKIRFSKITPQGCILVVGRNHFIPPLFEFSSTRTVPSVYVGQINIAKRPTYHNVTSETLFA